MKLKVEKGQILYIIAIAMVALLGMSALGIDGSIVFKARRTDQSIADSAALAGAGAAGNYIKKYPGFTCGSSTDSTAQSKARQKAIDTAGLYTSAAGTAPVLVNGDISSGNGVVTQCLTDSDGAAYITVNTVVSSQVNTYFLKMIRKTPINTKVQALAKVTSTTLGSILQGNGLVSLSSSGCGIDLTSTVVKIDGGGIFDNSNLCSNWAPNITTSACIGVVGTVGKNYTNGSQTIVGPGFCNPQVEKLSSSAIETMFSVIPAPPAAPTCTGANTKAWTWTQIVANGPGTYCFPSNTSLALTYQEAGNGSPYTVTIPGTVNLVFSGTGGFSINGGTYFTIVADQFNIWMTNGSFYGGGTQLNIPNTFRIYSTGTSTTASIGFDGGSTDTFGDIFMYIKSAQFGLRGSINFIATAPDTGPYNGIIVYKPITNTTTTIIEGGGLLSTHGSILSPGSTIQLNGTSTTAVMNSQIVGNLVTSAGGSKINISYDPSVNYMGGGKPIKIDLLH